MPDVAWVLPWVPSPVESLVGITRHIFGDNQCNDALCYQFTSSCETLRKQSLHQVWLSLAGSNSKEGSRIRWVCIMHEVSLQKLQFLQTV